MGIKTLVRLLAERGLSGAATNYDRRSRLSRSYRGNLAGLLHSLDRAELLQVAQLAWEKDGRWYAMRGPSRKSAYELADLLIRFDAEAQVPDAFDEVFFEDEGEGESEPDESTDEEMPVDETHGGASDEDPTAAFLSSFSQEWSRPLKLRRLVERLQGESVQRLMTPRFQAIVEEIVEAGLELQLPDGTNATAASESRAPGFTPRYASAEAGRYLMARCLLRPPGEKPRLRRTRRSGRRPPRGA